MQKIMLIKSRRTADCANPATAGIDTSACFDTWDSRETSMVFASLFVIGFFKKVSCLRQKKKRRKTCQENLKPHLVRIQPSYLLKVKVRVLC